ncbi:MAG: hypothetical protein AAGF31_07905 [Planctomycetota bacterium]
MTVQTFRDLMQKRPFEAIRVVMSSGETYDVGHPEMAYVTKSDLIVGTESEGDNVPTKYRILSMLHVTAVEPIATSPGGSPGSGAQAS